MKLPIVVGIDGDRLLRRGCARRRGRVGEVVDRNDDREVERLRGLRCDDVDGRGAAEEAGDLVDRPDRRRQADALHRLRREGAQALERQREMAAAQVTDQRVDLVDDDGAYRAQGASAAVAGQ